MKLTSVLQNVSYLLRDTRKNGGYVLVLSLDTSLDAKHLLESIFVTVLDFKCLPFLPELSVGARVAELGCVAVDRTCAINLAESTFHLCKLEAHLLGFLIGEGGDGPLVDRSRGRQSEVGGRLRDVELEHLESVFVRDCSGRTFVDSHGVSRQSTLFFQVSVHEIEGLGELRRASIQRLFEEVSQTLDTDLTVHRLGQVEVPEFERNGVAE